jgi:segregation and condensation protein A
MEIIEEFEDDNAVEKHGTSSFVVDIDGFEGPIDVLLSLAREQKVDISQISIVQLADQYLDFVALTRRHNLELAADYLVMAAWLAYLKSRLLLPDLDAEGEPSGEEMAMALAFQLKRLESIQEAGVCLMARNRLGQDFFGRGAPEKFKLSHATVFDVTLYDLLKAYGSSIKSKGDGILHIKAWNLHSVDDALERLNRVIGKLPNWQTLVDFLPRELKDELNYRSAIASTFVASLEMAREGKLKIRQDNCFGPIFLRSSKGDLTERPQRPTEAILSDDGIKNDDK